MVIKRNTVLTALGDDRPFRHRDGYHIRGNDAIWFYNGRIIIDNAAFVNGDFSAYKDLPDFVYHMAPFPDNGYTVADVNLGTVEDGPKRVIVDNCKHIASKAELIDSLVTSQNMPHTSSYAVLKKGTKVQYLHKEYTITGCRTEDKLNWKSVKYFCERNGHQVLLDSELINFFI